MNWSAPKTPELIMADMLKAAELKLMRREVWLGIMGCRAGLKVEREFI